MADEKEVLDNTEEQQDEGLEAEADANDQDGQVDEDGADAEGSAEGDGADAQEGQVDGEPRRPSRGEVRFQKLSQTAKEATERAANAEKRAQEMEARLARLEQPRQEQPRGKSPEELALMTPDELINYRLGEATKGFEQKLGAIQWATYEQSDRAAFASLAANDTVAARLAPKVEERLRELRSQGQNVDRERLLTYLIGEEVRAKGSAARQKQQGDGQRRIAKQTVRSGGQQRSDTQSTRGRMSEAEAREKRLENITF